MARTVAIGINNGDSLVVLGDEAEGIADLEEELDEAWQDGEEASHGTRARGRAVDLVELGGFEGLGAPLPDDSDGDPSNAQTGVLPGDDGDLVEDLCGLFAFCARGVGVEKDQNGLALMDATGEFLG